MLQCPSYRCSSIQKPQVYRSCQLEPDSSTRANSPFSIYIFQWTSDFHSWCSCLIWWTAQNGQLDCALPYDPWKWSFFSSTTSSHKTCGTCWTSHFHSNHWQTLLTQDCSSWPHSWPHVFLILLVRMSLCCPTPLLKVRLCSRHSFD